MELQRIFLHFFDLHFLEAKGAEAISARIAEEARLATRFAILAASEVLVPAASYFESSVCRNILDELEPLFGLGIVWLIGNGSSAEEFRYQKLQQYPSGSPIRRRYSRRKPTPPFKTRNRSSTKDIVAEWTQLVQFGNNLEQFFVGTTTGIPRQIEERWLQVPERLEGRAFIVDHVMPLVAVNEKDRVVRNRLHSVVNRAYFNSYTGEFKTGVVSDLVYLAAPHQIPSEGIDLPYAALLARCRIQEILSEVATIDPLGLIRLRDDERWLAAMASAMGTSTLEQSSQCVLTTPTINKGKLTMHNLRSFLVHGHDRQALFELKDYLQNTLGMPEPIVLEQQAGAGRTVIEKFEECSQETDIAFVLLTPDDVGGSDTANLTERARQNVIFELGYFVGKFGRRTGRTILLHKGKLEIPSDLSGVIYIDVTHGPTAAGEIIRRELAAIQP
jgi:predicted nucleotide-binding protein